MKGWKAARLEDIPSSAEIPVPGSQATPEEDERALAERAPWILERWEAAAARWPDADRRTHAVRRYLGISSFGANAFEASAGSLLVIPHDETGEGEGQEELYLVVRGRARFLCDGKAVELGPGELLYARPGVQREAVALETPTMLFLVGGRPGEPYAPPIWSRDWSPPGD